MKRLLVCVLGMTCLLGFSQSKEWTNSGGQPGNLNTGYVRVPASITQSTNTSTITALNSVSCPAGDNSYFRRFDLDGEFGIAGEFTIDSVDFGIENLTGITTLTTTVNLYTIPTGAPLTFANLTLIGTAPFLVNVAQAGTVVSAPVTGTVTDPTATDLVVEVFAPDITAGGRFFIGSNALGQTAPSFLASAACGAAEPTDTGTLGFPGMHIVMIVNGDVQSCSVTSIFADNGAVTINGDCATGLDVWCQSDATGDVLLASGVVVNGSATLSIPTFTPDAVYYTTLPGETGIANAVDGVISNRTVPTLGEWGMLAFITLLMGSALVFMKKQRSA